mmetsp:Transcript_19866/g.55372  ORF Transcript_19866/g.55372 Transcript_19866/m.55372 type:complete len:243 (-) Transcript_19866:459-1187(-)
MNRLVSIIFLLIGAITIGHSWTSVPIQERPSTRLGMAEYRRRDFLATSGLTAASVLFHPAVSVASYIDPVTDPPKITKRVYLDVAFGSNDEEKGRLVIGLFGDLMPKTTQNFEQLCTSNAYAGTNFYRVISDFSIQGGAVGDSTGKTGQSSFEGGKPFEPDNFNLKHTKTGLVSMVRGIGGGVDSRFFVNTQDDAGWADDRYAAFGVIEEGLDLVKAIEKVPVKPPKNSPNTEVKILASGVL